MLNGTLCVIGAVVAEKSRSPTHDAAVKAITLDSRQNELVSMRAFERNDEITRKTSSLQAHERQKEGEFRVCKKQAQLMYSR